MMIKTQMLKQDVKKNMDPNPNGFIKFSIFLFSKSEKWREIYVFHVMFENAADIINLVLLKFLQHNRHARADILCLCLGLVGSCYPTRAHLENIFQRW